MISDEANDKVLNDVVLNQVAVRFEAGMQVDAADAITQRSLLGALIVA